MPATARDKPQHNNRKRPALDGAMGGGRAAKQSSLSRQAVAAKAEPLKSYHGVTHHLRTGRFESHIWENGRQCYLGSFDAPELAALSFDIACIKYRGLGAANLNFHASYYEPFVKDLDRLSSDAVVAALRRQSKGSSGVQSSIYRGVTRHMKGKWEARIGSSSGRRYQYLGLHDTEIQAAIVYDRTAISQKGTNAVTNFHLAEYLDILTPCQVAEALQRGILAPEDLSQPVAGSIGSPEGGRLEVVPDGQLVDSLLECILGEGAPSPQTVLPQLPPSESNKQ